MPGSGVSARRLLRPLAVLALLAPLLGCGDARDRRSPILLVAVDGLEWNVVLPMLERGGLPALRGLMERGRFGLLETITPTLSPVIWTSIATSRPPSQHGIANFVKQGGEDLYTNRDRRVKAIWNIASEHDRRVAVIGWWMTYPVEPVDGIMVAQTNTVEQIVALKGRVPRKGTLVGGMARQVHPPERQGEVMRILEEVEEELPASLLETFGSLPHPLTPLGERLWKGCMWSFRADATYLAVAHHLLEDDPTGFDLFAVYLGGPDVVGHRFWRHLHPELYVHPPGREELENFHGVIEATYTWVDRAIGRLVDAAGPDATVWVVSDHGMEAVRRRARFDPRDPPADLSSGHHRRPLPGVVVAAGPDILPGETPVKGLERAGLDSAGSVFDVTPTLLALLGLPVADDMAGRVLTGWIRPDFLRRHPVVRVATHDDPAWQEAHRRLPGASLGSEERLEQLRALGYLD